MATSSFNIHLHWSYLLMLSVADCEFTCACREGCTPYETLFEFQAPCGSNVTLFFTDDKFYPNYGKYPLDLGGSTCKIPKRKLCTSCGPFTFPVICDCKVSQHTVIYCQASFRDST